ncbi:alpha/beta hydrolase [Streptomyces sp. CC219B]|uniref:alpha/beta hydrolase n=1 Tax=Streptomyces sp. CC219B TaxID=3044574 RepID=UPI0024A87329|nr:alpha/beta hydrolase [Streptomyces sp. CC219B]
MSQRRRPPLVLERAAGEFARAHVCPTVPWGSDPGPSRAGVARLMNGRTDRDRVSEEWLAVPGTDGGRRISVRILRPADTDEPLPVVLFLHGMGWMLTDASSHGRLVSHLVLGVDAAVVVPDYCRVPEARYPVAVEQVYAVARWIAGHGQDCRLDGSRIAVMGASAGGNLAAALTLLAKERGGVELVHQVLVCPVTDARTDTSSYHDFSEGFFLSREAMRHFWQQYAPDPADRRRGTASPLHATDDDLACLPPALVITAEADVLRDEGESYAARLRRSGVPVASIRYQGTVHGFVLFDALWDTEAAKAARTQTLDTLYTALHPWPT